MLAGYGDSSIGGRKHKNSLTYETNSEIDAIRNAISVPNFFFMRIGQRQYPATVICGSILPKQPLALRSRVPCHTGNIHLGQRQYPVTALCGKKKLPKTAYGAVSVSNNAVNTGDSQLAIPVMSFHTPGAKTVKGGSSSKNGWQVGRFIHVPSKRIGVGHRGAVKSARAGLREQEARRTGTHRAERRPVVRTKRSGKQLLASN